MAQATTAKKPQDHKPKAEKPKAEPVEITLGTGDAERTVPGKRVTIGGITIEVPDEALDDFEVLDALARLQDNHDGSAVPTIFRRLLGDDARRVLGELRDPVTGRVPVERATVFTMGIFEALAPNS